MNTYQVTDNGNPIGSPCFVKADSVEHAQEIYLDHCAAFDQPTGDLTIRRIGE